MLMKRMRLLRVALALLLLLLPVPVCSADTLAEVQSTLPDHVQAALARIESGGRRMIALRAYLRSERSLEARWSWTSEEIAAYEKSPARKAALDAVAAVTKVFEEKNPGFSLHVNTHVRSLDEQIAKWNRNRSVGAAAAEIEAAWEEWSKEHAGAKPSAVRAFLLGWEPEAKVMIAVPGLSPHGRARAFDFQITKNGAIIVAANTRIIETVWNAEGWTEKLKAAVTASGMPFDGPLQRPPEPWHYDYRGGEGK